LKFVLLKNLLGVSLTCSYVRTRIIHLTLLCAYNFSIPTTWTLTCEFDDFPCILIFVHEGPIEPEMPLAYQGID